MSFIEEKVKQYNIEFYYAWGEKEEKHLSWKTTLDLNGKQNPTENYIKCFAANRCITLKNGVLFTCPRVAHIDHFNEYFSDKLKNQMN